jgi:hypothetical protein
MSAYTIAQAQLLTLSALLQCEVKEYKEDWRETPVVREGGRFASSKTSNGNPSSSPNTTKEAINRATQSVVRGVATQVNKQVEKLSPSQQQSVAEIIDSRAGLFVKKKIRQLVDPAGQAAFDRVTDKMQGKGEEVGLADRIKAGSKVAQEELKAAATSPVALTKGVLGGLVWPLMAIHGLNQASDSDLGAYKETGKIIAVLSGAGMLKSSIEEINQKAQVNLKKEERQQLSEELNEFFLGVKKLEQN